MLAWPFRGYMLCVCGELKGHCSRVRHVVFLWFWHVLAVFVVVLHITWSWF